MLRLSPDLHLPGSCLQVMVRASLWANAASFIGWIIALIAMHASGHNTSYQTLARKERIGAGVLEIRAWRWAGGSPAWSGAPRRGDCPADL